MAHKHWPKTLASSVSSSNDVDWKPVESRTFVANGTSNYAVIAQIAWTSGSSGIYLDGRILHGASVLHELRDGVPTANDLRGLGHLLGFITAPSAGEQTVALEMRPTTATSCTATGATLIVLELAAADEYVALDTETATTSSTMQDQASLSFTPASTGNYLIIAACEISGSISARTDARLFDGTTGFGQGNNRFFVGGESVPLSAIWRGSLSGAQSWKWQVASDNGTATATLKNGRILALRQQAGQTLDGADDRSQDNNSTDVPAQIADASVAVDAAAHMVLGTTVLDINTASVNVSCELQVDGGAYGPIYNSGSDISSADFPMAFLALDVVTASATRSYRMAYRRASGSDTAGAIQSVLAVLELAPATIPATKLAIEVSSGDAWQTAAELTMPARPFLAAYQIDETTLRAWLDSGATDSQSVSTPNAQSGDLIALSDLTDAGADEARLADLAVTDEVFTAAQVTDALRVISQRFAPLIEPIPPVTVGRYSIASVDFDNYVSERGQGYTIIAASGSTGAVTASISGTSIIISSDEATGADVVTVTARSNHPLQPESTTQIQVTVTAADAWANGYTSRHRVIIPPVPSGSGTVTDFPLRLRISPGLLDWINAPNDLRFETAGGALIEHYRYQYGDYLDVAVLLPSWDTSTALTIFAYTGNQAATDSSDAAAVFSDYLAVWRSDTGADLSGNGRNLTPTSITAADLQGPGSTLDGTGTSYLSAGAASWLDGLTALTVTALVDPDAAMVGSNSGFLTQGTIDGSDATAGITLQYLDSGSAGQTNVVHAKLLASDGSVFALSQSNAHSSEPHVIAATWAQTEQPKIYINGSESAATAGNSRAGAMALATGGITVGKGARDTATGATGLIGDIRIRSSVMSAAWLRAEAHNLRLANVAASVGAGELSTEADAQPVAAPHVASVQAGQTVDIAALANAFGSSLSLFAVGAGASAVDNVLRYTAPTSGAASALIPYTLTDGENLASGLVHLDITTSGAVSLLPKTPPASTGDIAVPGDQATIAAALAVAQPGNHIILANGTYSETLNISQSGSAAGGHIVIRAANQGQASITGKWTIGGSYIWAYELNFDHQITTGDSKTSEDGAIYLNGGGSHFYTTRCEYSTRMGIYAFYPRSGDRTCYNEFIAGNSTGRSTHFIYYRHSDSPTSIAAHGYADTKIALNYFERTQLHSGSAEVFHVYLGRGKPLAGQIYVFPDFQISDNFAPSSCRSNRSWYAKMACQIERNVCLSSIGVEGFRHGRAGKYWANQSAKTIILNGGGEDGSSPNQGHDLRGNVCTGDYRANSGHLNASGNQYQAVDYLLMVGNTGTLNLGYISDGGILDTGQGGPINNASIYAHNGAVNKTAAGIDAATLTESSGNGGYEIPSTSTITAADVGLSA